MKRSYQVIQTLTIFLLISSLTGAFLFIPKNSWANPGNTMILSPSSIQVEAGEEFDIEVILTTEVESNCIEFLLTWQEFSADAGVIRCDDITEGNFFSDHGQSMVVPYEWDETTGMTTSFSSALLLEYAPPQEGVVAVLHFIAEKEGIVNIKFVDEWSVLTRTSTETGVDPQIYKLDTENCKVTIGQSASDTADLTVKEITPEWITGNEGYKVGFTVKNQGGVDAGSFEVALYIDGESEAVATETITSLAAGAEYKGNFSNFEVTLGDDEDDLKVCADIEEAVEEGDEDNNCLENKWPGADLVIADVVISWLQQDETYKISYKVKNAGSKDTIATKTSININGENKYVENCPELEPEETFEVTYGSITVSDNIDIIKICADSDKQVDESNENNNCQQKQWPPETSGNDTTTGTDSESSLAITDLSREWVEPGKKYNVNFTLENQGYTDASSLTVNLFVDEETEPAASETIDELKQGETYEGHFNNMVIDITDEEDTLKLCIDDGNNCRELTVSSADTAASNVSPLVPETRPPTPGITISWEYIGGIIGLVFLIGLLGFALGRRQNDHGF